MDSQRVHDIRTMNRNRIGAQLQLSCDLLVRFSIADELQDFYFTWGEPRIALALQRLLFRKPAIENGFAFYQASDRRTQFQIHRVLEHVSSSSGIDRLP